MLFPFRTLLLAALVVATCWAQFSPGKLSKAHSSLDSPAKCANCHGLQAMNGDLRCLGCHSEIRQRLQAKRGLHAAQLKTGSQRECASCHAEHNGANFVPIRWDVDLSEFDHGKTGYVLEGAHRRLDCRKCHLPKNIPESQRRRIVVKDLKRTYLGLTRDCVNCHGDQHRGQLSLDCQQCHNQAKWKPASQFDHGRAKFQLAAAHLKVVCEKCHARVPGTGQPFVKFTGLSFSSCDGCHKDPHRAAFQSACQSCHSLEAWKPASTASKFDHSRTKFALLGKHTPLACGKCHLTSNFKEPVLHARCADCHKKDVHRGQFASRADRGDCSGCHTVNGWKPSTFDLAAHRSTGYPLNGRHATVVCAKCHTPAGEATVYRVKFGQCSDCHADRHTTQLVTESRMGRCEDCHTVAGFRPSTYPLARHATSRFPLSGAHVGVACLDCHSQEKGLLSSKFHLTGTECTSCHEDPHQGQFKARLAAAKSDKPGSGCESCHVVDSWQDLSKFDHATTQYPLKDSHRNTECRKCHPPSEPFGGMKTVRFSAASKQCAGCHEDIHGGQFAVSSAATDCGKCHEPKRWKPASFDHNRGVGFELAGAHVGISCRSCHKTGREINGRYVVLFKSAPKDCAGCHGAKTNG